MRGAFILFVLLFFGIGASAQPPASTSAQIVVGASAQPPASTSAQIVVGASAQPPVSTSAQIVVGASVQPPAGTSAQIVVGASAQPPVSTSVQPPVSTSAQPPASTSAQIVVGASAQPPVSTSARVSVQPPVSTSARASVQTVIGDWGGVLNAGSQSLKIIFHISAVDSGYTVAMDSPDQGAFGLPASSVACRESALSVRWDPLKAIFKGRVVGDSLKGLFVQGGFPLPLTLVRGDFALRRPQTPQFPFPYHSEEVQVQNRQDSVTLVGTLTLPEGMGPFPAVVLVTGSGAQNRDEELMGHKPFAVIADYLTRRGIAVLRCDDRGVGVSTGNFATSTTEDFTRDALAGFDYLQTRPEVVRKKVGIIGHSEGGTIVFMAAAQNSKVAFVVSLAGVSARGDSVLLTQNRAILLAQGAPEVAADAYVDGLREAFRLQKEYSVEYLREHRDSLAVRLFASDPDGTLLPVPVRQNLLTVLTTPQQAWMPYFKQNDPISYIRSTRCPVLALNGTKDVQVDAAINLGLIRQYAVEGGNKRVTTKTYEGLNHLFQTAVTGSPNEYAQIEETLSSEVLADIAAWILEINR